MYQVQHGRRSPDDKQTQRSIILRKQELVNNYERMTQRMCYRFVPGVHVALCVCGGYFWEHSHRWEQPRRWVLIRDDERERMRNRWYEEVNTRRYRKLQRR